MTTAALGSHSTRSGPFTRSLSQTAAAPPGVLRTRSAQPAHTNDIARVTTMSGTRVTTTRPPFTAPMRTPSSRTPITMAIASSG